MAFDNSEHADATFNTILDSLGQKERQAVLLIHRYGGIDGSHHKMWVLDQVLRTLLGEESYDAFIEASCFGEDGPNTYEWDEGIAP